MSDGIIANNEVYAERNRLRLSDAFEHKRTVRLPAGDVYIDGLVTTPSVVGLRLRTLSGGGYPVDGLGPTNGLRTRVIQVGSGPLLRLSGAGFICNDPIEWVGDSVHAIIEVEGNDDANTGRHRFRDQTFLHASEAIKCLATPVDTHADNSIVEGCAAFDCTTFFRSENLQSVNWSFRDCEVNVFGDRHCVVADLESACNIWFDGLIINDPQATLFKLHTFNANAPKLEAHRVYVDRSEAETFFFTVVKYAGAPENAANSHWIINADIFVSDNLTNFDPEQNYDVPIDLPQDKWNITGMPE